MLINKQWLHRVVFELLVLNANGCLVAMVTSIYIIQINDWAFV